MDQISKEIKEIKAMIMAQSAENREMADKLREFIVATSVLINTKFQANIDTVEVQKQVELEKSEPIVDPKVVKKTPANIRYWTIAKLKDSKLRRQFILDLVEYVKTNKTESNSKKLMEEYEKYINTDDDIETILPIEDKSGEKLISEFSSKFYDYLKTNPGDEVLKNYRLSISE